MRERTKKINLIYMKGGTISDDKRKSVRFPANEATDPQRVRKKVLYYTKKVCEIPYENINN